MSAALAASQAALALAAESGDHAIALGLLAAGRWPPGIAEGRIDLF